MAPKKKAEPEKRVLLGRPKGNLKMGLVGLPNVGKSTTFNLLSKQAVPAENYPFCTIEPYEARMNVPDDRFKWLCKHFHPKSEVPANLTIYDIAGLVPGAHKGEGLGNAFLSNIQSVDGIYHVVRVFEDEDVTHTEGEVNPVNDMITINDELRLKDLDRVTKVIEDRSKVRQMDKAKKAETEVLIAVREHLDSGRWIADGNWKTTDVEILNEYQFLTAKPVVYLINMSVKDVVRQKNKWLGKIAQWVKDNNPGPIIPYSAYLESQLADIGPDPEARKRYFMDIGLEKGCSAIDKIITTGYSALKLIHYFTCGEDEVRCWTIRAETKAPQAAGVIHTDFEKGFICADVYKYEDIVQHGSEAAVKAAGKLAQRGKEYVVEDGDIIFFKFNPSGGGSKK